MTGTVETDDAITQVLQTLDEEILFAVLDVTLDINSELIVSDERSVYIQSTRTVVRFPVLYPGHSVGSMYRYVELRGKGLQFLRKHGRIESFEYHKTGMSGFEGRFEVNVADPRIVAAMLIQLRAEQNRRHPKQKIDSDISSATAQLLQLADSFHRVALRLRERRGDRPPVLVKDEYDVQYVLAALLETRFEDIRPEEWGPSYAGHSTRVDFFLKNESVVVETKMMRERLSDKKVGDELIIDIAHYKQREGCMVLVCFVYDPDYLLSNPSGLEGDLSRVTDGLDVRVLIRPST